MSDGRRGGDLFWVVLELALALIMVALLVEALFVGFRLVGDRPAAVTPVFPAPDSRPGSPLVVTLSLPQGLFYDVPPAIKSRLVLVRPHLKSPVENHVENLLKTCK